MFIVTEYAALNNLIQLILKPILSQFYVLSVQKCVQRQVQQFS